ncbi:MAG: phosphatase PAP2 family protein [Solirubrobacteraceae bacterium]
MRSPEEQLLRLARSRGHGARTERAVARFSRLGEHGAVWLAIGALGQALEAAEKRRWRRATRTVAAAYLLNSTIKLLVRRERPRLEGLPALIDTPTRLSFPSAHASTSFAGALAYSRLGLPAIPLYALAGSLSISRLYLGVHYPSDILAGAVLGTALAGLCTRDERRGAPDPTSVCARSQEPSPNGAAMGALR